MKKKLLLTLFLSLLLFSGCKEADTESAPSDSAVSPTITVPDSNDYLEDEAPITTTPTPEITATPTPEPDLGGSILPQEYYDLAKELSKKYHITIRIAEQCNTDFGDMLAEQIFDTDKIQATLLMLDRALSNYPKDFFLQLNYSEYKSTELNLVGKITYAGGIDSYAPTAFSQQNDGKNILAISLLEDMDIVELNLYHESSHIIDKVLEYDSEHREDSYYSEDKWQSLNPESFIELSPYMGGYYGSYDMMPMEYFEEEYVPYFISFYAMSFSSEDRATIFAEAMMGHDMPFTVNAPLMKKLDFYCTAIRDTFDTTGWPEETVWERILN